MYACNHAATEDGSKCSYDALVPARTDYRLDVDDIPEESLKVTEREKKDGEMQVRVAICCNFVVISYSGTNFKLVKCNFQNFSEHIPN